MKIKSNVNLKRKHEYDAGIDIPLRELCIINSGTTVVIDTGVTVEIPKGMFGMLISRSSAAKRGLITAMSPIDSGYTGSIHVIVTNTNTKGHDIIINKGEAICQLVIMNCVLVELTTEEITDDRKGGNFGSTNN